MHGLPRSERAGHYAWSGSDRQEISVERWQLRRNRENDYRRRIATEAVSQSDASEGRRATDERSGFGGGGIRMEFEPLSKVNFGHQVEF